MFDDLLIFTALASAVTAAVNIAGTSLYDVHGLRQKQFQLRHPYCKAVRRRPLVSVIVVTRDDASTIVDCLESLLASSYRKLEVIVADNASSDNTKQRVRRLIADRPNRSIKLYARQKPASQGQITAKAYNLHAKGEIVMLVDSNALVSKFAIKNAVAHFNFDPDLGWLSVNYRLTSHLRLSGLFCEFSLLLSRQALKASSAFKLATAHSTKGGSFYSTMVFKKLLRDQRLGNPQMVISDKLARIVYADDVVISGPELSFKRLAGYYYGLMLNRDLFLGGVYKLKKSAHNRTYMWLKLTLLAAFNLLALATPIVLAYFTYLAFYLHQPAFLLVGLGALAIILLSAILEDSYLRVGQKVSYALLMPICYSWFCLLLALRYVALLKQLGLLALAVLRPKTA